MTFLHGCRPPARVKMSSPLPPKPAVKKKKTPKLKCCPHAILPSFKLCSPSSWICNSSVISQHESPDECLLMSVQTIFVSLPEWIIFNILWRERECMFTPLYTERPGMIQWRPRHCAPRCDGWKRKKLPHRSHLLPHLRATRQSTLWSHFCKCMYFISISISFTTRESNKAPSSLVARDIYLDMIRTRRERCVKSFDIKTVKVGDKNVSKRFLVFN